MDNNKDFILTDYYICWKGDKKRHTTNVDLEACEEDQDTLKGKYDWKGM